MDKILKEKQITTDKKRQLTREEIEDYEAELGDAETWLSEGTVEEAEKALKRSKAEEAYMYQQYKTGKLDPAPGEKTENRMKFLQKRDGDKDSDKSESKKITRIVKTIKTIKKSTESSRKSNLSNTKFDSYN
jgi:hypothetical protein